MSMHSKLAWRPRARVVACAAFGALLAFGLDLPAGASAALDTKSLARTLSASPLGEEQKIVHVLNRLGYGPRPGDVEEVRALGLAEYIARQLDPERIDDSGLASRLTQLETIHKSSREL